MDNFFSFLKLNDYECFSSIKVCTPINHDSMEAISLNEDLKYIL